jgi:hypothetical protein
LLGGYGEVSDKLEFEVSANSFLKALIKLSRKFFGSRRRNAVVAVDPQVCPQSAKQPHAALASVKKSENLGVKLA